MKELIGLLQQYGGWATTAFIGYAIVKFYQDFKKTVQGKDELIRSMNETHHTEMIAVIRECTAVLTSVNDSLIRYEQMFREGKE